VPVAAFKRMEDGGELFREREKPAVCGRLLIAQSMDQATGRKASAGDVGGEPGLVHLSEETGDLTPAGALAGLAGIAYEHEVEVQTVAGGIDHAVGAATDKVAEDGQKLEENGGGVGLSVGSDGANGESREAMEGGFVQVGIRNPSGRGGSQWFWRRYRVGFRRRWKIGIGFRWLGVLFGLRLLQEAEEFGSASLYIGESGYEWSTDAGP
jgi:hypothetical protein